MIETVNTHRRGSGTVLGFPLEGLKGVPLLARAASLIGHLIEESARPIGFYMSEAGAAAVRYDGPVPEGFVADEG